MASEAAALPTYRTAARVLEQEKGSGLALAGWTVLRTLMIAPPMMVIGVPAKQAFAGAMLGSGLISLFTLLRLFNAREMSLAGLKPLPVARALRARRARPNRRSF